ncbi:hypothetical protein DL93DRAFT_2162162 [Clavulina sp. PMI_390]|nr:hypothetical protein DL93DRAFT_2162162 [Clavulina sp. PMI_390]
MPRTFTPTEDPANIEVPGLDPSAPYEDQIELLDQLITLKLQETDEHWADIHKIIINELLPTVRRYSEKSQPTREAAHFWKEFYETAANIKLPTPGGERSTSSAHAPEQEEAEYEEAEEGAEEEAEDGTRNAMVPQDEEREADVEDSFASDHTPTNPNYSFNPAVASTPGRPGGETNFDVSDPDLTSASSVSSFPSFAASMQQQKSARVEPSVSSIFTADTPKALRGPTPRDQSIATSSISHSSLNVFSNSPSPDKKGKGKAKVELREKLLRKTHEKGKRTPVRVRNPFRNSIVPTAQGDVVDLSQYSASSSDATLQLDLSPKTKLKIFSTPQYKLALRTKEEAVAIQMSEARARASDYSSSDGDFTLPPTPMTARKRAAQQATEREVLMARFERDMERAAGGTLSDPESDSDEDDYDDDHSGLGMGAGPVRQPQYSDSDSDSYGMPDDTMDLPANNMSNLNSMSLPEMGGLDDSRRPDDSYSDFNDDGDTSEFLHQPMTHPNLNQPAQATASYTGAQLSYETSDDYDDSGRLNARGGHSEPTETLFGLRGQGDGMSQREWQRKLAKPLPGRDLPDQGFQSPSPSDPAGRYRTSGGR